MMSTSELIAVWVFIALMTVMFATIWWSTRRRRPARDDTDPRAQAVIDHVERQLEADERRAE